MKIKILQLGFVFRGVSMTLSNINIEAVARRCSVKKVLLVISQNSRKTPVPESLFNKVAGLGLQKKKKKRL